MCGMDVCVSFIPYINQSWNGVDTSSGTWWQSVSPTQSLDHNKLFMCSITDIKHTWFINIAN